MKRRFSLLFAIVLLLSVPFLVSGLTPEKPYPDLADGDQLTATWLMGTFNTLYSWSQGTNATLTAHIATYTPHARIDGATINTPKITSGTASGTVLTNCSIAGLSLSGTTINSGTMSGGTVTGVTVSNSTIGDTNSIDGGAVKSGTVADDRIDSALARDSEVTTAVTNHNSVTNPHSATSANTASRIVMRDASGNFSAGTITANLTGNCSGSSGSCTGNAATATKVGTSTVGGSTTPVYINAGTPTACDSSLGVSITGNAATATKLGTSTVGGSTTPVYINAGTPTACESSLAVSVTGSSASCTGNSVTATTANKIRTSAPGSPADGDIWLQ